MKMVAQPDGDFLIAPTTTAHLEFLKKNHAGMIIHTPNGPMKID